jgi:hypothetical protein
VSDVVMQEPRAVPEASRGGRAARLVLGAGARMLLACALALLANVAAYLVVGGGAATRCGVAGGRPCAVAIALAGALLAAMPALHAVVAARSAALRALGGLALDPALGASERILGPVARALAARLARARRVAAVAPVDLREYPFFVRSGMRLALHLSGLARLSRSVEYVRALDVPDPAAEIVRLLRRDLAPMGSRSVSRGWVWALNCAIVGAAWAAVRFLEDR